VDEVVIDCKFQERQRRAYYELCRSQRSSLLSRLNTALVVGVISDTVGIAERVRDQGASSSREDLVTWKKTLQSFQHLVMDVAFIIRRLNGLLAALSSSSRECAASTSGISSFSRLVLERG
jgi:hypothetical protein